MEDQEEWKRTHYSKEISEKMDGKPVILMGWLRAIRKVGKLTFLQLADRDGFSQIIVKGVSTELAKKISELGREDVVAVQGTVKANKTAPNGFEVLPNQIKILNKAEAPLPLEIVTQKTPAELFTRLNARFLDLRKPEIAAIFRIKNMIVTAAREYWDKNNYTEIHSPKLMPSASESGANVFAVTYFKTKAYLAQSPQFYKQMMMASGFDKVYEIAPVFRAEKHHTHRHVTEYTSMDFEMAFSDFNTVMSEVEKIFVHIYTYIQKNAKKELDTLGKKIIIPKIPFPRVTMKQAYELLEKQGVRVMKGEDLNDEQERMLGEICKKKYNHDFVFLTEFPWGARPFYHMKQSKDTTKSSDLLCNGLELVTLAQREHRYKVLMEQLKEKGMRAKGLEFYLNAFRYGMPPHGGAGIGLDRLVMCMLGLDNIREAVLFPRDPERLAP